MLSSLWVSPKRKVKLLWGLLDELFIVAACTMVQQMFIIPLQPTLWGASTSHQDWTRWLAVANWTWVLRMLNRIRTEVFGDPIRICLPLLASALIYKNTISQTVDVPLAWVPAWECTASPAEPEPSLETGQAEPKPMQRHNWPTDPWVRNKCLWL